ncbi:WD40 repeat domain-containing protein [Sessilibacter corallicola]|uniref:PQQ-binding-like beta-propeller repeat protein n=1 Tax=Sessilibacter corallicola TaxID=2904075 RepID=A0ABQ0A614_9GAMM
MYSTQIRRHDTWLIIGLVAALCGCEVSKGPSSSFEIASKGTYSASYDATGQHLVIGSIYHGGSLWDKRGERLFNWNHKAKEASVIIATSISHNGKWAATAEKSAFAIWSLESGQATAYVATPGDVLDIALSANGNLLLVGLTNNSALLYQTRTQRVVRTFQHRNTVRTVALSADGRFALTGSEDRTAILWDVNSGKSLVTKEHEDDVQQVAISDNGELAMSAAQYDKAIVWRTNTGKELGQLPLGAQRLARGTRFTAARFSADGNRLLTGQPNRLVQLWDVNSLKLLDKWELPKRNAWKPTSASVQAVAFTSKNSFHAVGSNGFAHKLTRD